MEFDVIAVTETWIDNLEEAKFLNIENYFAEHFIRSSKGGGVTLYINKSCEYVRKNVHVVNAESLFVELKRSDIQGKLMIGCIYRPPNMCKNVIREFTESVQVMLNQNVNRKYILLGDMNIDLLQKDGVDFSNEMCSMGLILCINIPTRVTTHSNNVIDHIFTNILDKFIESGTIDVDISDHKATFVFFENLKLKFKYIHDSHYFNFRKYRYEEFEHKLKEVDWSKITENTEPNPAYDEFCKVFYGLSKCYVDEKSNSKAKKIKKPWVTSALLISINTKYKLYKKTIQAPFNIRLKEKFNRYKNLLRVLLRKAEKKIFLQTIS